MDLQAVGGGCRWIVAPEERDEPLGSDHMRRIQEQERQNGTRASARNGENGAGDFDFERPQQPEVQG